MNDKPPSRRHVIERAVRQAMCEIGHNYPGIRFSAFDNQPLLAHGPIKRAIERVLAWEQSRAPKQEKEKAS